MNHLNKNPDAHRRLAREARCVDETTNPEQQRLRQELLFHIGQNHASKIMGFDNPIVINMARWCLNDLGGMSGRW